MGADSLVCGPKSAPLRWFGPSGCLVAGPSVTRCPTSPSLAARLNTYEGDPGVAGTRPRARRIAARASSPEGPAGVRSRSRTSTSLPAPRGVDPDPPTAGPRAGSGREAMAAGSP